MTKRRAPPCPEQALAAALRANPTDVFKLDAQKRSAEKLEGGK